MDTHAPVTPPPAPAPTDADLARRRQRLLALWGLSALARPVPAGEPRPAA